MLRDGAQEAEVIEQLRATMRQSLASYKRPQAYKVVDALPKGSTGKILKRDLRERFADVADDGARFALMSWYFEEQLTSFKYRVHGSGQTRP